jgi:NAD(P)H-hydrate epimerase
MVEDYGILLVQMMENAGRCLADLARIRFLDGDPVGRHVVVLAGPGGNGGGGLVSARRLNNRGADVEVWLSRSAEDLAEVPRRHLDTLQRIGVAVHGPEDQPGLPDGDVIVDALLGYSLRGAPRGRAGELIVSANESDAPVLALDVPSGIDSTTGETHDPTIVASATMTLALPKTGLRADIARENVGEFYLADIGVPPALYARPPLTLEVGPLFAQNDIVRMR